jgi:endonuclease YncB( thermonuclease family)
MIFLFLVLLPGLSQAAQFKVTRVYDGDTVKVLGQDVQLKIRLVGIDAPETSKGKRDPGQPFAERAKKYLAGLVLNKNVEIIGYELDRYNRVLGLVVLEGKNVNLELVKAGLAEVYRGDPARGMDLGPYWAAEKEAREAKRGMWDLGEKYISPRAWRHSTAEKTADLSDGPPMSIAQQR